MKGAKARRLALKQLLLSGQTGTQQELCDRLRGRGFEATQSTISRDLKALNAQRRQRADGEFAYHLHAVTSGAFDADMVQEVVCNEALILMRTQIGRAQAVGLDLDAMRHPDVLGTLAGDDTVLVIPRTVERVHALASTLRELSGL